MLDKNKDELIKVRSLRAFLYIPVILGFVVSFLAADQAWAVRVSMKRVSFEGDKRTEVLSIINNTDKEQSYRLGWKKYRMREDKALQPITEGEPDDDILWAEDIVRFAPRRFTIPPGGSQQVRLLLRRKPNMQEAEYRAHLWIVAETKPEDFRPQAGGDTNQAVRLAVQPAITLPVFVRNGKLDVTAEIKDTKLTKSGPEELNLSFTLERQGSMSTYGDLEFVCTSTPNELVLKQVRGISVYTEINKRTLSYSIPLTDEEQKSCSSVKVVYRSASPIIGKEEENAVVLAEGSAKL